jgi:hypothetical protein
MPGGRKGIVRDLSLNFLRIDGVSDGIRLCVDYST